MPEKAPDDTDKIEGKSLAVLIAALAISKLVVIIAAYRVWGCRFLIEMARRWDGEHFIRLVEGWYSRLEDIVFPPLYPCLAKILYIAGLPSEVSALIVSNIASIIFVLLLYRLWGLRVALFTAFLPTFALYGTLCYAEPLAWFFTLLAYKAILEKRLWRSVVWFTAALLSKYQVALLTPPLLYLAWRRFGLRALTLTVSLLAALALLYPIFEPYGGFQAYLEAEKTWDAGLTTPIGHVEWLLSSWFVEQDWRFVETPIPKWAWLARNILFYTFYACIALLCWRRGLYFESLTTISILAPILFVRGVPAVSAPRFLTLAYPSHRGVEKLVDWGILALLAALTFPTALWHFTAFFA